MTDLPPPGDARPGSNGRNGPSQDAPGIRILAQYIRDLSFESPHAPESLRAGPTQPQIDLGVELNARARPDGLYEVELKLTARATRDSETVFHIELVYAGLFQIIGVPEADMEPVLMIECPRYLFPFARRIIADLTAEGGFPPFMLEPIDFAGIYASRKAAAQRRRQPTSAQALEASTRSASSELSARPPRPSARRATKAAWAARSSARSSGAPAGAGAGHRRPRGRSAACAGAATDRRQVEAALAAAVQLQIDVGQQLGVDQRAVLLALGQRDPEALTERVQRVVHARESASGPGARVSTQRVSAKPGRPARSSSSLTKSRSKAALWATSAASPTNSRKASHHLGVGELRLVGAGRRSRGRARARPRGRSRARDRCSGGTSGRWG